MTNAEIVNSFIQAINDHDVDKIYNLMSEDQIFVDGYGDKHVGKNGMQERSTILQSVLIIKLKSQMSQRTNSIIGLFGYAKATYKTLKMNGIVISAKDCCYVKAIVEHKKIKYWQVFCDYTRLQAIIDKN